MTSADSDSTNTEKKILSLRTKVFKDLKELDKEVMMLNEEINCDPSPFVINLLKEEALKVRRIVLQQQRELQFNSDREALLGGRSGGGGNVTRNRNNTTGSSANSKDEECQLLEEDITASLVRLNRQMAKQVEKSERNLDSLKQGTKKLSETSSLYDSFEHGIKGSRLLIKGLWSREMKDRRFIYFGLFLYLSVVLWVLSKRIPPLRWAISFGIFSLKKTINIPVRMFYNRKVKTTPLIKRDAPFVVLKSDKHLEELKIDFIENNKHNNNVDIFVSDANDNDEHVDGGEDIESNIDENRDKIDL